MCFFPLCLCVGFANALRLIKCVGFFLLFIYFFAKMALFFQYSMPLFNVFFFFYFAHVACFSQCSMPLYVYFFFSFVSVSLFCQCSMTD